LRAQILKLKRRAPLVETLIAQSCIDHDVGLVTRDVDFRAFVRAGGLRLLGTRARTAQIGVPVTRSRRRPIPRAGDARRGYRFYPPLQVLAGTDPSVSGGRFEARHPGVCERGLGARSAVGLRQVPCDVTPLRQEAIVNGSRNAVRLRGCHQKLALCRILGSLSAIQDGPGAKALRPRMALSLLRVPGY